MSFCPTKKEGKTVFVPVGMERLGSLAHYPMVNAATARKDSIYLSPFVEKLIWLPFRHFLKTTRMFYHHRCCSMVNWWTRFDLKADFSPLSLLSVIRHLSLSLVINVTLRGFFAFITLLHIIFFSAILRWCFFAVVVDYAAVAVAVAVAVVVHQQQKKASCSIWMLS